MSHFICNKCKQLFEYSHHLTFHQTHEEKLCSKRFSDEVMLVKLQLQLEEEKYKRIQLENEQLRLKL
jgi:hypothetical protein